MPEQRPRRLLKMDKRGLRDYFWPTIFQSWEHRSPVGKTSQVVGILFGKGYINPNRLDLHSRTPLSRAAGDGHEGVVKLLLGWRDVSSNTPDAWYGQTQLSSVP